MSSTRAADRGSLAGRTALITGGSRGIGLECARALVAEGMLVALVARDSAALRGAAERLGPHAAWIGVDFSEDVAATARLIRRRLVAGVDVIVNNAAEFFVANAEDTSVEDFERAVRVNLSSHFGIVREFLGGMKERGSGHIVTIGSIADRAVFPENGAYAASKHGLRALHEVMREELRGSGVRATLISPGPVDTPLWDPVSPDDRPGFTPRARMLSADAVADAIVWSVTRPAGTNVDEMRLSRA